MRSHTVPRKLLEQFAYDDATTRSKRLWRYEKGRPPHKKASPRTATRIDRHFSDPEDAAKESEIEKRLNQEFEEPVNKFLFEIADPGFISTEERRRQLTFYVTLLFQRSEARRLASTHLQDVFEHALKLFTGNESQILTVAAKWGLESGLLVTNDQVVKMALAHSGDHFKGTNAQRSYVGMIQKVMSELDKGLFSGEWNYIRTVPTDPFILSDAPVVTWQRMRNGSLSYGLGFYRPDVEVLLPISPVVCLHIQPNVERSAVARRPTVREVNAAQAAFAVRACFSNIESAGIDGIFQENFRKAEMGVNCFTIWHRNYDTAVYDILMSHKPRLVSQTQVAG
ncbi:MAG: DUF4238 domain-containing protein [Terriglobales bacterium]